MIISASQLRLRESAGDELRGLLSPITPQTFVADYWAKKPLFVKGFPDKFQGFFDAAAFSGALSGSGPMPEDFLRASFDRKTGSGASAVSNVPGEPASTAFRASVEQAVPLFDAGATLCVSQIETRVPALVSFIAAIKRQLGYPGKVSFNAYLSPRGSGFNWHFDGRIASTLQIEGTKRWRFSNAPAIAWPRANGTLRADGTATYADATVAAAAWERLAAFDERDLTEVLLEPGDLLILPAGVWHEACGGEGGSLALNLSFTPISYTQVVRNLLDSLLTPEPSWRSPGPLLPNGAPGEVDPSGVAAMSAQLARASALLGSLSGDSAAVVRLWGSLVQNPNPGFAAPPIHATPRTTTPIVPNGRLRVRDNIYALLADGGSRLCVMVGTTRTFDLSGEAVRFVQRILAEKSFVAADCVSWKTDGSSFTWSDVEEMLRMLQGEGLFEDATEPPESM